MAMKPEFRTLLLSTRLPPAGESDGPFAALYVMVMKHRRSAKVGALESAANAAKRLQRVQAGHRRWEPDLGGYPMQLAVVAELEGLTLPRDDLGRFNERWAEVEHLESALRLVLARRVGRLARWTDWIHVERVLDDDDWVNEVGSAWLEVDRLGRSPA